MADRSAREGALRKLSESSLQLEKHEINSLLENTIRKEKLPSTSKILSCSRSLSSLIYKIRLKSWKTKFTKNVYCTCGLPISIEHILFDCPVLSTLYSRSGIEIANLGALEDITHSEEMIQIASVLTSSKIASLL